MRNNVIDFPKPPGRLENDIRKTKRLLPGDKAKFAANLGALAAEVNQADPLSGAQKITNESGIKGIWEKRKRYFRLPGETAPVSTRDGEYGSTGVTFVELALAAARLMSGSDQSARIGAEARRAIRKLAEGTSFLKEASVPTDSQDQTAKSLLDEFAARLSAAVVERTRIRELWRILDASPFDVEPTLNSWELPSVEAPSFDDPAVFPPSLLSTLFSRSVGAARFVTGKSGFVYFSWANPRIKIGYVAIPVESRIFVVPKDVAAMLSPENDREEGVASREVAAWFDAIASKSKYLPDRGLLGRPLPEIDYSESTGFGWKACFLSVICEVYLQIEPGVDGVPIINILIRNYFDSAPIAFSFWDHDLHKPEQAIRDAGFGRTHVRNLEVLDFGWHMSCKVVHALPFDAYADDETAPPVIGMIQDIDGPFDEGFDAEGWTGNPEISDLLMSNMARFYPTVPDAEPTNGPLVGESIGAAILHNVIDASQDTSIASELIKRAQLTADAGLRFHEALIDRYREAIRSI